MVKVSVLLCTYRWGGLDVSLAGLSDQTFRNFEVILCDPHYDARKDAVEEYNKKFNVPLVHVRPFRDNMPLDSGSKHRNSAICYAEGEICIFLCDYAFVRPDWIQRHWNIHEKYDGYSGVGPHRYRSHPAIKEVWEKEPITIFKEEFRAEMIDSFPILEIGQDTKLTMPALGIAGSYFHMKNESIRTETLMALNGCDEGFDVDGGHCYSDMDLGLRSEMAGNPFWLDPENIAEIVQVRDFYPTLLRKRSTDDDFKYFESRQQLYPTQLAAPNDFSMRETREKMLWQKKRS